MGTYEVYLETSTEGRVMAHVPSLLGCFARGESRQVVLERVPRAIVAHHAWLLRHGEPVAGLSPAGGSVPVVVAEASGEEPIEIRVVDERVGIGPFDRGDAAALFTPDRQPVSPQEMELALRLMDHAREDLLTLACPLPQALLDWQPYADWFSIRQVLRHVGNAEEWYVSRLVPPERLPPEWENDAALSLFEFLEMERRTAVGQLRQLTPSERSGVYYPTVWTQHPEEAWTLRKVLRRILEHELEHTVQVQVLLDLYRRGLLAGLAAEGTALVEPLLGLGEEKLTREKVAGGRTAGEILAYLAARDRWELQTAAKGEAGKVADFSAMVYGEENAEPVQAAMLRALDKGLAEVAAELTGAQEAWLAWLEALPEGALFLQESSAGAVAAVAARSRRLQEYRAHLAAWRAGEAGKDGLEGSVALLRAALVAARQELLAGAGLILAGETSRPVCGTWTLKDVIGHVVDWELVGLEGLRDMAAGRAPQVGSITDIDAWNEAHVAARRGQSWAVLWTDLHETRKALFEVLEGMDRAAMARSFRFPWGPEGTAYQWLCVYVGHDHEHAAGLRAALCLPEDYSSS